MNVEAKPRRRVGLIIAIVVAAVGVIGVMLLLFASVALWCIGVTVGHGPPRGWGAGFVVRPECRCK